MRLSKSKTHIVKAQLHIQSMIFLNSYVRAINSQYAIFSTAAM